MTSPSSLLLEFQLETVGSTKNFLGSIEDSQEVIDEFAISFLPFERECDEMFEEEEPKESVSPTLLLLNTSIIRKAL